MTKKPSRAEPVTELKGVPILESGEPLVNFLEAAPGLVFDRPRFEYRREMFARQGLAERLDRATALIQPGYRIAVIECWRAPLIQQRMYRSAWNRFKERNPHWSDAHLRRVTNQFSAPMNLKVPPPHTTGGAVDLTLIDPDGNRCDLNTPYEFRDPKGFFFDAPGLSDEARKNRAILAEAMVGAGITNYPSEYWHWSYGDQGWAYRGGEPHAIYGAITPNGWTPDPADVKDEPLEFVEYEE